MWLLELRRCWWHFLSFCCNFRLLQQGSYINRGTAWTSRGSWLWRMQSFLHKVWFLLHQDFSLFLDYVLCMSKQTIFTIIHWSNSFVCQHSLVCDSKWMLIFENFKYLDFWVFKHPHSSCFLILISRVTISAIVVELNSYLNSDSCFFASATQIENFSNWNLISNCFFFLLSQIMLRKCPGIEGNSKSLKTFIKLSFAFYTIDLQTAAVYNVDLFKFIYLDKDKFLICQQTICNQWSN